MKNAAVSTNLFLSSITTRRALAFQTLDFVDFSWEMNQWSQISWNRRAAQAAARLSITGRVLGSSACSFWALPTPILAINVQFLMQRCKFKKEEQTIFQSGTDISDRIPPILWKSVDSWKLLGHPLPLSVKSREMNFYKTQSFLIDTYDTIFSHWYIFSKRKKEKKEILIHMILIPIIKLVLLFKILNYEE